MSGTHILSENSGLENSDILSTGVYFNKGNSIPPWSLWLISGDLEKQIASFPTSVGGLIISKTDHLAQEDNDLSILQNSVFKCFFTFSNSSKSY